MLITLDQKVFNCLKNPWIGLASYEEPKGTADDYLFCGRDEETMDLVRLIDNNLFVTLYGSSGIGKTSLLRAGVIPILRRKGYYPLYVRLSQEPSEISYSEAIVRKLQGSGLKVERSAVTEHLDGNDRLYLWEYFGTTRFLNNGREVYPVIILDQFEEVFRESDKARAELLLKQIYLLLNDELEMSEETGWNADTNYRFLASIREDYLFILEDSIDENTLDLYKNNRYRLRPLKEDKARQVVLVPGRDCIEEDEKEAVAQRVIELSKNNKSNTIDTLLLSLVCASTFAKKANGKLVLSDFKYWGDNPMRVYYQEAIRLLGTEQVRSIQKNCINKDGSRKQVAPKTLQDDLGEDTFNQLLKGPYRILTRVSNGQIELLHDQLAMVIFEDRDAYEERERHWKLMEMQSRLVTEKANKLVEEGDKYTAQRLLLEVLPENLEDPKRPYTEEAEKSFRNTFYHIAALKGHNATINSVSFSPDGKRIVSASADKTIRIWNAETGKEVCCFEGNAGGVGLSFFSLDGKRIVSVSGDDTVRIWDVDSGKEEKCLEDVDIYSASFSPDGRRVVTASRDKTIKIWDTETGKKLKCLRGHNGAVGTAFFRPDGERIVSASQDGTIRIWDADSGKELICIKGSDGPVRYASFSPTGALIVSVDEFVHIWDAETGKEIRCLEGLPPRIYVAAFSPDRKPIIAVSSPRIISIWNYETGKELGRIPIGTHYRRRTPLAFSHDGKRLVFSSDKTIFIGDIEASNKLNCLNSSVVGVDYAAFSPDGANFITMDTRERSIICIWDVDTGKLLYKKKTASLKDHAVYSPDGEYVAFNDSKTIRILDPKSGNELCRVEGHQKEVNSIVFSTNGKRVVSTSDDRTIRISDVETGKELRCITEHNGSVGYASFSPDGKCIVSISEDYTVRTWNAETCEELLCIKDAHHSNFLSGAKVVYSSNGLFIILLLDDIDNTIVIWDSKTGREVARFVGDEFLDFNTKVLSPDGKRLRYITSCVIHVWDIESGQELLSIKGPDDLRSTASFSPDGKKIASVSKDGTIRIWDVETGQELSSIKGPDDLRSSASFSPDGKRIVSVSKDGTIRIWDVETTKEVVCIETYDHGIRDAIYSPDGKHLLSVGNSVRFWDAETGVEQIHGEGHNAPVRSASYSPDGERMVSASWDKTIRIWDAETGVELNCLKGHDGGCRASFSPNGKHIVSSSLDCTVRLWDAETGRELKRMIGHDKAVGFATFSPDGKRIVSASDDHTLRIWDADTGKEMSCLKGHLDCVNSAFFSPNGKYVVSASDDSIIRIWNVEKGRTLRCLKGHKAPVYSASFSPDGGRIVSASDDSTIRIWDTETGKELFCMEGHEEAARIASFSPDGKHVVSASFDHTIRVWDTVSGKEVCCMEFSDTQDVFKSGRNKARIVNATFTPNGKRIMAILSDGTIKTWLFPPLQELIDETSERFKDYPLTTQERRMYYLE